MVNTANSHPHDELNRNLKNAAGDISSAAFDGQTPDPHAKRPISQSASSPSRYSASPVLKSLSEMKEGVESDCFVQLVDKEKLRSRDFKYYFKLIFRDRRKSIQAFIWPDHASFQDCDKEWNVGSFFKIRGKVVESNYGSRLEIRRIREVVPEDMDEGFSPRKCRPSSELPPEVIAATILSFANKQIGKGPLLNLVRRVFKEYRSELYESAASRVHHRTYNGGLLEHTLSVTKLAVSIYEHFCIEFPWLSVRVSKPIIVAGAILHDVGKILDCKTSIVDSQKTLAGNLIGHQILGLEIVQRFATEVRLDDAVKYQLEHLILTHSRFPDWGAPTPPLTLEGMILHYADYADSTFVSAMKILEEDASSGDLTFRKGPFGTPLMKSRPLETHTSDQGNNIIDSISKLRNASES